MTTELAVILHQKSKTFNLFLNGKNVEGFGYLKSSMATARVIKILKAWARRNT